MSVLDTLILMFEAKGAKEVASDTRGVREEMDRGDRSARSLGKQIAELTTKLTLAIAPLKAFKAAADMSRGMSEGAEDLLLLSSRAGSSVEKIQQLGNALKSYGGNAASASAVMGDLNSSLQQMRMGQGGKLQEAALLYGLDMTGSGEQGLATADEMLVNIAKRMEGLNTQQQLDFGKMLGLDDSTLMMVRGGLSGLTSDLEKGSKMKVFTSKDIETFRSFQQALRQMKNGFEQVGIIIARAVIPILKIFTVALTWLTRFFAEHKAVAIVVFAAVGAALAGMAVAGVVALVPLIASVWSLAAGVIAATWPFVAIAAVIGLVGAALYLVYDDFMVFLAGGESVCGAVVDGFKWVWEQIKVFGTFIKDFWSGVWQSIIDKFHSIFGGMMDKFKAIRKLLGLGKETVDAGASAMEDTKTPLSTMTSNSISNSATSQNANNVSVQGITINTAATDADGISKDIGGSLEKQMQRVLYQNYSGAVA
jgi:hypothetical protein